jgi:hypothetical protein
MRIFLTASFMAIQAKATCSDYFGAGGDASREVVCNTNAVGGTCDLKCKTGFLISPESRFVTTTQKLTCTTVSDGVDQWITPLVSQDSTLRQEPLKCVRALISECARPSAGVTRTSFQVSLPVMTGPYKVYNTRTLVTEIMNDGTYAFPTGSISFHEYTDNRDSSYIKTCVDYTFNGISSSSSTCLSACTDEERQQYCIYDPLIYPDPPQALMGDEFTRWLATAGEVQCNSTYKCKWHVHTYTVPTKTGTGQDSSCMGIPGDGIDSSQGYVGYHYDPAGTGQNCEGVQDVNSCEAGDIVGKHPDALISQNTFGSFYDTNLRLFKQSENLAENGAFGRSIVLHHPNNDAWYCVALGKGCSPQSKPGYDGPNPKTCNAGQTSLVYISTPGKPDMVMYAGEDCGGANQPACIATASSRLYNLQNPTDPPGGGGGGQPPVNAAGLTQIYLSFAALISSLFLTF